MNRKDFGLWGIELAPAEFAKALAALGVFQASIKIWPSLNLEIISRTISEAAKSGLLPWRLSVVPPAKSDKVQISSARIFAKAWVRLAKSLGRARFELSLENVEDYFWIAGQLSVAAEPLPLALYVRVDESPTGVGWNWPLRIGFLKDDDSRLLRSDLDKAFKPSSLKVLVDFVDLANESDACDLLLLPQDVRGALSELLREDWRPKADCVLVLGGSKYLSARLAAQVQGVYSEARAHGVGVLFIAEDQRERWLKGLVTQLSHNHPLDEALFEINRQLESPMPLIVASRRLMELTLVSRTAERVSDTLNLRLKETPKFTAPPRRLRGPDDARELPARYNRALKIFLDQGGLPPKTIVHAKRVAKTLRRVSHWSQESGGATEVARHSRAAHNLIKEIPRKYQDRRIQAQVLELPGEEQQRVALKPSASYGVDVRIGPPAEEWESAAKPFPMENLPPSETGHDLTVVFTEPRVCPEPQVDKLFLPPQGATASIRFYFRTTNSLESVNARITVLHRNRVIQTAILKAPVALSGTRGKGIRVDLEARVLSDLDNLWQRQDFDAALVLNHANDGQAYATAMADQQAVMFSLDEASLRQTIDTLNGELTTLADDPDSYPKDIAAAPTTKLLNMLAIHGRLLYNHLFVYRGGNGWLLGKDKKKIQIVSTRLESNLPLEFLYDYAAPNEDAKLCAYAKKSLATGQCDKSCGGMKNKKTVVCPLGFWGLNRVIERHAFDGTVNLQGNTYALKAAATSQRQPLQVLQSSLFAASGEVDKARKGTIKRLEKVLKTTTKRADYVLSWKDWVKKVKSNSPTLLLLLSHTEFDEESKMSALEISKLPRLRIVDIVEKYVRKPGTNTRPLVMLVGCKTNAPDNLLHSFVPAFGTYAAIVLSTGATVLAIQAAQVATEVVRALSKLPKKREATFGDVMLDVRRQLLAKGVPMVLCLSAYGDADWKLA
jgi:hypothetical protein